MSTSICALCPASVEWDQVIDPLPLCSVHRENVARWGHRQIENERRDALKARSVVYVVRRADGLVKIGFSSDFDRRLARLQREHGPLEVLTTRRGSRDLEQVLHGFFDVERQGNSEWFAWSPRLAFYVGLPEGAAVCEPCFMLAHAACERGACECTCSDPMHEEREAPLEVATS